MSKADLTAYNLAQQRCNQVGVARAKAQRAPSRKNKGQKSHYPAVMLFNFVTFARFVVIKSLLEWFVSDKRLLESLRKQKLSRLAAHVPAFCPSPLAAFFAFNLRKDLFRLFGSWKSLTDRQRFLEIFAPYHLVTAPILGHTQVVEYHGVLVL